MWHAIYIHKLLRVTSILFLILSHLHLLLPFLICPPFSVACPHTPLIWAIPSHQRLCHGLSPPWPRLSLSSFRLVNSVPSPSLTSPFFFLLTPLPASTFTRLYFSHSFLSLLLLLPPVRPPLLHSFLPPFLTPLCLSPLFPAGFFRSLIHFFHSSCYHHDFFLFLLPHPVSCHLPLFFPGSFVIIIFKSFYLLLLFSTRTGTREIGTKRACINPRKTIPAFRYTL